MNKTKLSTKTSLVTLIRNENFKRAIMTYPLFHEFLRKASKKIFFTNF